MTPTISIVTPSYQHGRYLEWTVRSVLLQKYPNLEYVMMDGGSTDETPQILEKYHGYFTHCESARDGGQADAVARGFAKTSGEIMAYLNSDDVLAPGALDFVAKTFAEEPDLDAIYSHRVFVDSANKVESYWILPKHRDWLMKRWDYIPQETCFWRRRIYEQTGGIDPSFQFALDYDLFVRFMEKGQMRRVDRFLGAFRKHPVSKTSSLEEGKNHPEVERIREKYKIWFPPKRWIVETAIYHWIHRPSRDFASSGATLPGSLPGIGYNYDLVWKGGLDDPALP